MTTTIQPTKANPYSAGKKPLVLCRTITTRHLIGVLLGGISTIVAASIVAWNGDVPAWEEAILRFINQWPDFLEPVMWVLQQVGVLGAPVVAGLVIVSVTRRWQHLVPFVLVLPLKLGIEKGLVKQLVQRERPFVSVGDHINVRGPAFEGLSFPSGHTTTAFAVAILVSAFLPAKWRPLPIIWAMVVATARMYYGEHNFLDVVAGAAMGIMFATLLWYFFLNRQVTGSASTADSI